MSTCQITWAPDVAEWQIANRRVRTGDHCRGRHTPTTVLRVLAAAD